MKLLAMGTNMSSSEILHIDCTVIAPYCKEQGTDISTVIGSSGFSVIKGGLV
jgi:hypothetical protein